jgi:ectoine hydroxylase
VSAAYRTRLEQRGALVPRREPVAWRPWHRDGPLRAAQERCFVERGYLVLHDLFEASEIERLRAEAARLLEQPGDLAPETLVREPGGNAVRSIFAVHRQSDLFSALCADARLYDIARWLLNDQVYIHQSRLNYKPGFDGHPFYWHSDFETWHAEDGMPAMRALSISLMLDDNTTCNGPLMAIPASHLRFVPCVGETPDDHYRQSLQMQRYGVPDAVALAQLADANGIEPLTGLAGSVIVFDCNLTHGSNGNITPLPRSNLFLVYNAMSNQLREPTRSARPRPEFLAARRGVEPLQRRLGPLGR